MPHVLRTTLLLIATAATAAFAAAAAAQEYPVKAIRFIAPNLPAGPTDILARLLGQKMSESFGQPVVIENRAGAGGNIGTELAAKTPPDGYTLVTGNNATFGANPSLYKKMPFDPIKDFAPIVLVATQPNILVVHPALPVKNVKELIAMAKARPGQLNYANSGIGANAHLAAELFKSMTGTSIESIAYKSAAPALVDLIAGQVDLMFANIVGALPHIKGERLRPVAVSSATRSSLLPAVPAVADSYPQFDVTAWMGLFMPAGTPRELAAKIGADFIQVVKRADMRERLAGQGAEAIAGPPEQLADLMRRESAVYAKVIRDIGLMPE